MKGRLGVERFVQRFPVARAIAIAWVAALAIGGFLVWPLVELVRADYGKRTTGDASLFAEGGYELLELTLRVRDALPIVRGQLVFGFVLVVLLQTFPVAMLILGAEAERTKTTGPLRADWTIAKQQAWPLLAIHVVEILFVGVLSAIAYAIGLLVGAATEHSLGEARSAEFGFVATLCFAVFPLAALTVGDLAKNACVAFRTRFARSVLAGVAVFRASPISLFWSSLWRRGASLVPIVCGSFAATALSGRAGMGLFLLALIHQFALVRRLSLRASWCRVALDALATLRTNGASPPVTDGTASAAR